MKKKMNSKNIIVSFIFLIGGMAMLVFTLLVGIPSIKQSAEVCTLEVEAIVIDNKSDLKSDSDYGQSYRYNQVVEYVVEDKKIQTTIHNLTSDPVPEGTKITLWVDPENPYIYTNNLVLEDFQREELLRSMVRNPVVRQRLPCMRLLRYRKGAESQDLLMRSMHLIRLMPRISV